MAGYPMEHDPNKRVIVGYVLVLMGASYLTTNFNNYNLTLTNLRENARLFLEVHGARETREKLRADFGLWFDLEEILEIRRVVV